MDNHLMSGLRPGQKQISEQPTKIEHHKLKNHPDRRRKGSAKSESAQRKLQRSTSVPSDTTGLSANIQTTGLTSSGAPTLYRPTPAQNAPQIQTKLEPTDPSKISGGSSEKFSGKYDHLEIWVSHSAHEFKLLGLPSTGQREVLYETKVGLGFWWSSRRLWGSIMLLIFMMKTPGGYHRKIAVGCRAIA